METKVTVDNIITEWGNYYIKGGKVSDIKKALVQPCETLNIPGMLHPKTEETIYRAPLEFFKKLLQPWQKDFTPSGGIEFKPNEIRLRKIKIDAKLWPEDIEESYMGFLGGKDSKYLEAWPIVRYFMEQYIPKQIQEDMELDVVYNGVYKEPTPGTAGETVDCIDGFHKILMDSVSAETPINVFDIDDEEAIDRDNVVDALEAYADALDPKFKKLRGIKFFCDPDIALWYFRKLRDLHRYDNTNSEADIKPKIDGYDIHLHPLPSMANTGHMFCTIPQNMMHITKRDLQGTNIDLQKFDRSIKLLCDWYVGFGFGDNRLVYATSTTVAAPQNGHA